MEISFIVSNIYVTVNLEFRIRSQSELANLFFFHSNFRYRPQCELRLTVATVRLTRRPLNKQYFVRPLLAPYTVYTSTSPRPKRPWWNWYIPRIYNVIRSGESAQTISFPLFGQRYLIGSRRQHSTYVVILETLGSVLLTFYFGQNFSRIVYSEFTNLENCISLPNYFGILT